MSQDEPSPEPTPETDAQPERHPNHTEHGRCRVCGWPQAASRREGCVDGDCSMRPVPSPRYDVACQVEPFSSRTCQRGIRSCTVDHDAQPDRDGVTRSEMFRALHEAIGGDSIDAARVRRMIAALLVERDALRAEVEAQAFLKLDRCEPRTLRWIAEQVHRPPMRDIADAASVATLDDRTRSIVAELLTATADAIEEQDR